MTGKPCISDGRAGTNTIHQIAAICSDKEAELHFYHDLLVFPIIWENYRLERDNWKIDLRINGTTELVFFIMKEHPEYPFSLS